MPLRISVDEPAVHPVPGQWFLHSDFFALYIVNRGRGIHTIDDTSYGISRGDVYLMYPGMRHRYSHYEDLVLDTVHFPADILDNAMREALAEEGGLQFFFDGAPVKPALPHKEGRILHLTPAAYSDLMAALTELRTEWARGTLSGDILTIGLFFRLLVFLSRTFKAASHAMSAPIAADRSEGQETTISAAVRYLDAHFSETVRIQDLADMLCLSPDRFTKLFISVMGQTPRHYLGVLRLERAKVLLSTTDDPISEISWQSGFEEPAYFARTFRSATGMSPREYRRQFTK